MKITAQETYCHIIQESPDQAEFLIKRYAKQVAKQALNDAAEECDDFEDNRGEHKKAVLNTEIKLP